MRGTLLKASAAAHSLGSDQVVLGSQGPSSRHKVLCHVAAVIAVHPHLLQRWVPEQLHAGTYVS